MKSLTILLIATCLILFSSCSTSPKKGLLENTEQSISIEEFQNLHWLKKVNYLKSQPVSIGILKASLLNKNDKVVITSLKIVDEKIEELNPTYTKILSHKNPIVRLYAYEYFFMNSDYKKMDVALFRKAIKDKDWIIKERVVKEVRSYPYEKLDKRLYYSILIMLKYHEPNTIREVYKTLLWYKNPNILSLLYKRAYNVKSILECKIILDVLSNDNTIDKDSIEAIIDDIKEENKKNCVL